MVAAAESQERRQQPRLHLAVPVPGTLGLTTPVRLVDVSPTGARVECGHPLTPGQSGILDVGLPAAEFYLRARVTWSQVYQILTEGAGQVIRHRAGLRFVDPPAAGGTRLYALLAHTPDSRFGRGDA